MARAMTHVSGKRCGKYYCGAVGCDIFVPDADIRTRLVGESAAAASGGPNRGQAYQYSSSSRRAPPRYLRSHIKDAVRGVRTAGGAGCQAAAAVG